MNLEREGGGDKDLGVLWGIFLFFILFLLDIYVYVYICIYIYMYAYAYISFCILKSSLRFNKKLSNLLTIILEILCTKSSLQLIFTLT